MHLSLSSCSASYTACTINRDTRVHTYVRGELFSFKGLVESSFGPTLLDLIDIYDTEMDVITLVFIPKAIGSIIGSSLLGILLDKFADLKFFLLSVILLITSASTALLPNGSYLWVFFMASMISSFGIGGVITGGNVLCLTTWSGGDAAPYMHTIHFTFAIGHFIAPLIAIPFLSPNRDDQGVFQSNLNQTIAQNNETKVIWLYPMLAVLGLVCSSGFVMLGLKNCHLQDIPMEA